MAAALMRATVGAIGCALLALAACTSKTTEHPPSSAVSSSLASSTSPVPTSAAPVKVLQPDLVVALQKGDAPQNPFAAYGSLWVAAHHAKTVIRLDLRTGAHQTRIRTGAVEPGGITAGAGRVWVTHYSPDGELLVGIDPATNRVVLRVPLPGESCCQPAVLGSTVWVASGDSAGPGIVPVDAVSGHVGKRIPDVDGPVVIGNQLWVSQFGMPAIVDTQTRTVTPTLAPRGSVMSAAPPAQGLTWFWNNGAVVGVGPDGTVRRTVKGPAGAPLGGEEGMVVTSGETVWATNGTSILFRIDPGADTAVQVTDSGHVDVLSIAGDGTGGVWLAVFDGDKLEHYPGPG